ncbi:hypothetical protein V500_05734 [Pseudogymnoascus sp. VKM F-4518 (FW-2643)]|nr:hypothetical protein V500_05734 [Pseudogymnoascus sp. VKM F-4518 (FW-2643)]
MDPKDFTPSLPDAQSESVPQLIQSIPEEPRPRPTRRRRSSSPETDRPRRNLRPRLTHPSYFVPDLEDDDFDSDSTEDTPLTVTQANGNTTNQPTITSDADSPNTGPSSTSQTNGNTTIEPPTPSSPVPTPGASPMAPQTKTATEESDIDFKAEDERELLSIKAEIASLEARKANLEANVEARKMDALFVSSMSDTKECEDTLMVALVDANKLSDEDLHGVLDRMDERIVELTKRTMELFERLAKRKVEIMELIDRMESGGFCMSDTRNREDALTAALVDANKVSGEDLKGALERLNDHTEKVTKRAEGLLEGLMRRRKEIKGLIDGNALDAAKIHDGESEMKPLESNDGDYGGYNRKSATEDDKDDGGADKTIAEDDESDDEDGNKGERMSCTKDDEDYESDESDDDDLDDFLVDNSEDYEDDDDDYDDGRPDKSEHYVAVVIGRTIDARL